jgi:hypothetical protein
MTASAAGKSAQLDQTQSIGSVAAHAATRKIWLPKFLYDAIPWFYLVSGLGAFVATLYVSEWFWVLPHYLLFSAACVHLGFLVLRRRRSADRGD